ncbi:transposase family protein [Streptomyces sp. NPDC048415]|uniref:transposase family protein n=1 Tax=Streptomyces sp. NPDC048415 TaxID=3154822 RepID=UPI003435D061
MPDPRNPRGIRHALVAVLALTACAVLAGATSVLAVREWINDAPPYILERLGVRLDPLFPKRFLPAETTVRRLLARIDGDALDRAVGRWLAARRSPLAARRPPPAARRPPPEGERAARPRIGQSRRADGDAAYGSKLPRCPLLRASLSCTGSALGGLDSKGRQAGHSGGRFLN